MKVWLLKTGEPIPLKDKDTKILRMGMLAKELISRGHEIIWFTSTFDHLKKEQLYNKDTKIKLRDNYYIYLSHAPSYKKNISIKRILNHKIIANKFKKISRTLKKPDIIYVSFPTIDYAEVAIKYGKKYNVPVIVDIRDLWPDIFNHNLPKILRILATPYIKLMNNKTKNIMKKAYAINSISESMLEWGLKKGNREKSKFDRFFYIGYNRQENNNEIKEKDIINKNKFNISFVATINNQFDYDKIIQIANLLKDNDIVINICGDGPKIKELREKAKDYSNIKLLGWLEREKIDYILKHSKIGLAPYKNTFDFQMSVSNKFGEYISYGLPVVITSEGYMKKILQINNCGISSQNVEEICKFIMDLKNNNNKFEEMSNNAKKLYEKDFVAKKIYKNLVDYLEEIKGEF